MIDSVAPVRDDPLFDLGWSEFFSGQLTSDDDGLQPVRVAKVHRARITAMSPTGALEPVLPADVPMNHFAVGDFVLVDPKTLLVRRRLDRRSILQRRVSGTHIPQCAGANIDTLFIVTSCDADFNPARLERYLAVANQAGTEPVILLTKADLATDPQAFHRQASALQRGLDVVIVNPKASEAALALAPWCARGQTVAVVGSSGVGKSTLVNTLVGSAAGAPQLTGAVREHDSKGRHTTTARSLHAIAGGGWVIDTPGIRTLQVSDVADGLDRLFAEITERAPLCRFSDCTHAHEPQCAVQAGVIAGDIDPERLARWRKLKDENADNDQAETGWAGRSGGGRKRRR